MQTRKYSYVTFTALLALTVTAFAETASAQKHQLGGFVNAVWLERVPLSGGQADAFRVWTAEDGSRIRLYDSVSDTISQQQVVTSTPETLHDIYLDQYTTSTENLFGTAVGTNGAAFWWDSNGHNNWKVFSTVPAPNKELWATAVRHDASSTTIWVSGDDHTLKCSQDLGSTWNDAIWTASPAPGAALTSMDFADWSLPNTAGIVGTNSGELFWTDDGMTWSPATMINGLPTPASPLIFWDISFRPGSATEAYAVGGRVEGNGDGFAWRTLDGGRTWNRVLTQLQATGMAPAPRTAATPANPCNGVPGFKRGIYTQTNYATVYGCHALQDGRALFCAYGGQIWEYDPSVGYTVDILDNFTFSTAPLWGIHGDEQNEVWMSGQFGILRRTSDSAQTFEAMTPQSLWRLKDMTFATPSVGYISGQSMRIAKSTDGGTTWTEQLGYASGPNHGPGIAAIAAYDENRVAAVADNFNGSSPVAFWTADGGTSCWNIVDLSSTVGGSLKDITSADLDANTMLPTFWACGAGNANWSGLIKSVDGGASWTEIPTPVSKLLINGVGTVGSTALVIVGRNVQTGKMAAWLTLNADSATPTWTDIFPNAPNGFLSAVAVNGAAMVAVGNAGRIYTYDTTAAELVPAAGSVGMTNNTLYQVDMVFDNGFIWAYTVGAKGTALRTLLGSGVWETRFSGTTDNLLGLGLQISGGDIKSWWCGTNGRWGDSTVIGPN